MASILIDSNVILDLFTEDPQWFEWSSDTVARCAETMSLMINPIIYAEVSIRFDRVEECEAALPADIFERHPIPWEAAFLAGKCFVQYRRRGGKRRSPLPDFFIGAHAAVAGVSLLTRDVERYRSYFPGLKLISP
jgi:predicted nucleic acid-binding protein